MVAPIALARTCPQCGADVRSSGTRCHSCGFWLPSAPPPRTGPLAPRPLPSPADSRRSLILVLSSGAIVVATLLAVGVFVWLRRGDEARLPRATSAPTATTAASAKPTRLEPNRLLAEARRRASRWHRDAVLVSIEARPLDAAGVAPGGAVELVYAEPAGPSVASGAEAGARRLTIRARGDELENSEQRGGKARVAPEPNCLFEDAWGAARRAGVDASSGLGLRYAWSDKDGRPIWEVVTVDGRAIRKLDGASCSILTR